MNRSALDRDVVRKCRKRPFTIHADQLRRCGFDEDPLRGVEIAFGKAGQRLLIIERVVFQASEPGE